MDPWVFKYIFSLKHGEPQLWVYEIIRNFSTSWIPFKGFFFLMQYSSIEPLNRYTQNIEYFDVFVSFVMCGIFAN